MTVAAGAGLSHWSAMGERCFKNRLAARGFAWALLLGLDGSEPHPALIDEAVVRCPGPEVCTLAGGVERRSA